MNKNVIVYNYSGYPLDTFIVYRDDVINNTMLDTVLIKNSDNYSFTLKYQSSNSSSHEAYLNTTNPKNRSYLSDTFYTTLIISSNISGSQSGFDMIVCIYNYSGDIIGLPSQHYAFNSDLAPPGYLIQNNMKYSSSCVMDSDIFMVLLIDKTLGGYLNINNLEESDNCSELSIIRSSGNGNGSTSGSTSGNGNGNGSTSGSTSGNGNGSTSGSTNGNGNGNGSTNNTQYIIIIFLVIVFIVIIVGIIGGLYYYKKM